MSRETRYVVGIDLGTTNTVISYVDTQAETPEVRALAVPQVVAPGQIDTRESLPSFLYLAAGPELSDGALDLPWTAGRKHCVGAFAREQSSKVPTRVVSSAKSWLCHSGVDRTSPLLPWQAPEDVQRISPLDASARYLEHVRDAWNDAMTGDDQPGLEQQDVLLTVPASFDAVARELTMKAAQRAGLQHVTLLEEPQAAFYAWLAHQGEGWRNKLEVGDVVLVCDIGGGTTDFSLITVKDAGGDLELERVAVGDHILLGGDNMDLALAVTLAEALGEQHKLDPWQTRSLWHACRRAKEDLFADAELEKAPVTILGRGSKVIGGSIKAELSRSTLERVVAGGFFPDCAFEERPARQRRAGLAELGLPYATDAAVTRHLAKFVGEYAGEAEGRMPTAVLYNGGVMKAQALRARVTAALGSWGDAPRELDSESLDLAVSHGAAYYGQVRRGKGIRIRGGISRSYYIGIESAMPAVPGLPAPLKAVCVVPFGMEEGTEADVPDKEFGMIVGEDVEFRFLSSTHRKDDGIGTVIERWDEGEIEELVPVTTAMDAGEGEDQGEGATTTPGEGATTVPVKLHSRVTEVGTLDLSLRSRDGRSWKLEYYVRDAPGG
ncbi:MAG: Hsp70 family protein [Myxococcales bacterium]|nr:Hsp70 family protein [Myxococcales bacterium]